MNPLRIVLPGLSVDHAFLQQMSGHWQLPALETLLSRGQIDHGGSGSYEHWCAQLFQRDPAAPLSLAAVSAAFDGIQTDGRSVLRADPVHLALNRDQLLLSTDVNLTRQQAAQLCQALSEHFSDRDMEFIAAGPSRWYLLLSQPPQIHCTPPSVAVGRNIHPLLPTGQDALNWHQIYNEIQMLMFDHPVNQALEAAQQPVINSVWLWGEGQQSTVDASAFAAVYSDDALLQMLAQSAQTPYHPWEQRPAVSSLHNSLLVYHGLMSAWQQGDVPGWLERLNQLDKTLFQPVLQLLRRGALKQLQLDLPAGQRVHSLQVTTADCWKFWRLRRSLLQHLGSEK